MIWQFVWNRDGSMQLLCVLVIFGLFFLFCFSVVESYGANQFCYVHNISTNS